MPKRYAIKLLDRAKRELAALSPPERKRVAKRIDSLAESPTPSGCVAMQGELAGYYRMRAGPYRIIYAIQHAEVLVLVVRVGHRREVVAGDAGTVGHIARAISAAPALHRVAR